MKAEEIRERFLKFFEKRGHKIIPSAPLVPENDPTVLFTTAGMHPLVPYLLGEKHPLGNRLVDCQKCIRTVDIDDVGDNTHLTFFEMLGNWSLGDYFKKEAIGWCFEFLTKELAIPLERLAISVFAGDQDAPKDEESAAIWHGLGVPKERLVYLPKEDNWWGPAGKTGPCGPDTEMFFWIGREPAPQFFDPANKKWVEIWNNVFMEYNKTAEGRFEPLKQKNVDTGMGLERVVAALNGKTNVYETELFEPIITNLMVAVKSSKLEEVEQIKAFRVIADHLKAATFILAEGVAPSNVERGYVLRRLIRRAIRYARVLGVLGIGKGFTSEIAKSVIKIYESTYPELIKNQDFIMGELRKEEECFSKALEKGLKEFDERVWRGGAGSTYHQPVLGGNDGFDLYQTYGFPPELMEEICKEKNILFDWQGFQECLKKHQELSRTASAGKFKSGLADHSEKTVQYHTATHLLHAALRKILGEETRQMGSNITGERLRFDFSFSRKLTNEEIQKVEDLVNQKIKENLEVKVEEMTADEALKKGAVAFFRERYPEKVKVYTIFNCRTGEVFSREICSGPHIEQTGKLGVFKIVKEEASSRGVRRIKAVLQQ